MVCSIGQAADAAYYMECQQSYRPADSYYVGGEEPDGVWFNPSGLFDLADGGKVETADWMALYGGFSPVDGSALTQNAGKEGRSAGLDMTFSADKTASVLRAVAARSGSAIRGRRNGSRCARGSRTPWPSCGC